MTLLNRAAFLVSSAALGLGALSSCATQSAVAPTPAFQSKIEKFRLQLGVIYKDTAAQTTVDAVTEIPNARGQWTAIGPAKGGVVILASIFQSAPDVATTEIMVIDSGHKNPVVSRAGLQTLLGQKGSIKTGDVDHQTQVSINVDVTEAH